MGMKGSVQPWASLVLAVLLASGAALVILDRAEAAFPGKNGKIAFASYAISSQAP
jgi:hypothetical protein